MPKPWDSPSDLVRALIVSTTVMQQGERKVASDSRALFLLLHYTVETDKMT